MKYIAIFLLLVQQAQSVAAQLPNVYVPKIEPCECPVKVDSSFKTFCAYLIVPESRKKQNDKFVKLPFIIVKSKNANAKKDAVLFTGGGPGNSSLAWVQGITKGELITDRNCIAFEQRGTRYAIPYLRSFELDTAIKEAYRKNLSKDSMTIVGVKLYKKRLEEKGIDLTGYNTDESVADIHDLIAMLKLDSVNLMSGSYGGGLMLAVLQRDPSKIRSVVLDSPLPTFIPIDEQEPANFMEALSILFEYSKRDSADKVRYENLQKEFNNYFTAISNKTFTISYLERGRTDSLHVEYTKNELLDVLVEALQDAASIKDVPGMIADMIRGNHHVYIKKRLDNVFLKNQAPDGMRISVYCADQANYNDEQRIAQFSALYPFLQNYHINNVYKAMCDCWNVPPVKKATKQPFYSDKPALLGDGLFDPACRPLYMDIIKHYLPNSQRFIFLKRSHGAFGWEEGRKMVKQFLDNPYKKISVKHPDISEN